MIMNATQSLEHAADRANQWVASAAPVIRAWLGLYATEHDLCEADKRTFEKAWPIIEKASASLYAIIEGVREEAICDHSMIGLSEMTDAQWDAVEEFNDALRHDVISVAAAIKKVGA
ncbi:hypothetical protein [Sphingobium sp. UBA5915]|uniref:hypothetical protein n=1 Tax=Sphingobium sp. UBA5915 TaxID=1947530 RepID=UPI0025FB7D20|nr:hypothetical protein [Sphingobium sp. UBA5915]